MNRGAKRPALFDSAPETSAEPALPSKRVMDAPSFDVHGAESSHQHLMAVPPLVVQQVESACQHVRALNTQFASWVQSQLQHHLDELWEDGVKDYLSHASDIMERFKDVVDWLKANAAKAGVASPAENESSTRTNIEALGDIDDENELQKPSSPSLKRTEEEGIVVVHGAKCKVYLKPRNPVEKGWKDMGMGQLSIKCIEGANKATKESKPTVVIRNDGNGHASGIEAGKSDVAVAHTC